MLSVNKGGNKYHFLSLCYDLSWDWTYIYIPTNRIKIRNDKNFNPDYIYIYSQKALEHLRLWTKSLLNKVNHNYNFCCLAAVASILLYGCTTWTLTKRLEKKLDGNYTRMNKSWRQHPTRHQLYGHLPPITKTIQVRRTRHAGHCWRIRDELISDVLLWTPTHDHAKTGRPARTYIQQLCEDTGCCPEDLPEAMNDREKWRERVMDIRATSTTWWWYIYIYIYINMMKIFTILHFYSIRVYIYIYIYKQDIKDDKNWNYNEVLFTMLSVQGRKCPSTFLDASKFLNTENSFGIMQ